MKQELQDKLFKKYPKIFRQKDLSMQVSCMYWGIDTGDGWYNIIDLLCAQVRRHLDWHNAEGEFEYNRKHNEKNPDYAPIPQIEAEQVKEKFGGLRFYTQGGDAFTSGLIAMAESVSHRTCEKCGVIGTQNDAGWIHTLCDPCRKNRYKTKVQKVESEEKSCAICEGRIGGNRAYVDGVEVPYNYPSVVCKESEE